MSLKNFTLLFLKDDMFEGGNSWLNTILNPFIKLSTAAFVTPEQMLAISLGITFLYYFL